MYQPVSFPSIIPFVPSISSSPTSGWILSYFISLFPCSDSFSYLSVTYAYIIVLPDSCIVIVATLPSTHVYSSSLFVL